MCRKNGPSLLLGLTGDGHVRGVWWSACLAFAWLAWYIQDSEGVAANDKARLRNVGMTQSLLGKTGLELGLRIWGTSSGPAANKGSR